MNIRATLAVIGLFAALSFAVVVGAQTFAVTQLSEEQKTQIKDNCVAVKSTLNQLHASDALLRVNRGQIYESVGAKLMNRFNGRLSSNGLDIKGLSLVSTNYQTALSNFRSDYQSYERQLSTAIAIDCTKDPQAFHLALEDARAKRKVVHDDVVKLHRYIDDYRSAVNDFKLNFERLSGDRN